MIAAHWEDYWASGGTSDRALGGADQRAFLTELWAEVFANHASPSATIVDVACGDGAIFAFGRSQLATGTTLIALDASPTAARAAMRAGNEVVGAAADARQLPLASGVADMIVSQFGLEYGGEEAFCEAARVLKDGGLLAAVCHLKDGAIDAQCRENARVLKAFADERLGEFALAALTQTCASSPDPAPSHEPESETKFRGAMQRMAGVLRAAPESTAKAMVGSAIREIAAMAVRRRAYDAADVSGFLNHVVTSLSAYYDRMRAMLAASLDSGAISRIGERLEAAGMTSFDAEQVAFGPGAPASAWRIEARRAV